MMGHKIKDCEHAIYDEIWGEYKCAYHRIRIDGKSGCDNCQHYIKRKGELKTCKNKE